jgi:hypothetical protein
MFAGTSTFTLVSGLVSAGAYAQPLSAATQEPLPVQVVESLQRARVDIYCGHHQQAVADIRAASRQLRASGVRVSPETLTALEQAAWLTRQHQHTLAEQSLEAVLHPIAAGVARS